MTIALGVAVFNTAAAQGFLLLGAALPKTAVSIVPFSLASTALSLLLVFRTNSAYTRFWEARSAWGMVMKLARELARQAVLWVPERGLKEALLRHMIAYPRALKAHLIEGVRLEEELPQGLLTEAETSALLAARHRPVYLVTAMAAFVAGISGLAHIPKQSMDNVLSALQEAGGVCDKIFTTPIPTIYTKFTNRRGGKGENGKEGEGVSFSFIFNPPPPYHHHHHSEHIGCS